MMGISWDQGANSSESRLLYTIHHTRHSKASFFHSMTLILYAILYYA